MLTLAFTATRPQAGGCLKMADERTKAPYNQQSPVPGQYSWPSLIKKDGDELFDLLFHRRCWKKPARSAVGMAICLRWTAASA